MKSIEDPFVLFLQLLCKFEIFFKKQFLKKNTKFPRKNEVKPPKGGCRCGRSLFREVPHTALYPWQSFGIPEEPPSGGCAVGC